jgi:hypothetical protein
MNLRNFSLAPFPGERNSPEIGIAGFIRRRESLLSIACTFQGDLSALAIPSREEPPARKDRLWEETCLEFFLGSPDSKGYWEFNLSPAGHWNVYRFTSYREGMREEPAFKSLPFELGKGPEALDISMELDIGKILPAGKAIEAGVSAVIKTKKGETTHWALVHPGPRPDFHRSDGFTLKFPGE